MTLRDDLIAELEELRAIPDEAGLRRVKVGVLSQAQTEGFGITGAVLSEHTTWIAPTPKVTHLDAAEASWYGADLAAAADGRGALDVYEVGPITPAAYEAAAKVAGWAVSDLYPQVATDRSRSLIVLQDIDAGGEIGVMPSAYRIVDIVVRPFRIMLRVRAAQPVPT